MKKYTLFSFVLISALLLSFSNVKPASAFELGCTIFGPYNILTGKVCDSGQSTSSLGATAISAISSTIKTIVPVSGVTTTTPISVSAPITPTTPVVCPAWGCNGPKPITPIPTLPTTTFTITTPSPLPDGQASNDSYNHNYLVVMGVFGGPANTTTNQLSWTVISGALPNGLILTASDSGQILTGTPTTAGVYNFTLKVATVSSVPAMSATKQFTLTVNPAISIAPTITVISPNGGEQWAQGTIHTINWKDNFIPTTDSCGINCHISPLPPQYYNIILTDTSSVPRTIASSVSGSSYNWKIPYCTVANPCNSNMYEARPLPGSYTISVCPAGSGAVCGISKSFNIVSGTTTQTPTITTASPLPNATVGNYYVQNIEVTGNNTSYYVWSVSSGTLPSGITLAPSLCPTLPCSSGGILSGVPTSAGTYTFTLQMVAGMPGSQTQTATKQFSLTVNPAGVITKATPTITSILPYGCTTTVGWSSTTGVSCSVVNNGEILYVHGSSFDSTSRVLVNTSTTLHGPWQEQATTLLSDSLLSFVAPNMTGTHEVQVSGINNVSPAGDIYSNVVNLNFISVSTPTQTSGPIVITNVKFSPASPKVNDLITTLVTIKNSTSVDVSTAFRVDVEGTDVAVASLAAGAQTTVTVPNAFSFSSPGTYSIPVIIIPASGNWYGLYSSNLTFTSTSTTGCTATTKYSTTTGEPCPPKVCPAWGCDKPKPVTPITGVSTFPIGCTTTSGYSTTTGVACNGSTPTYPYGCTSNIGYSSTTGVSCAAK